jgi:HD-GYP domain-containing protein (c-di-GMP phosphodiesterase class II)
LVEHTTENRGVPSSSLGLAISKDACTWAGFETASWTVWWGAGTDAILNKNGPLTDAEWAVMQTHSVRSEALVSAVPGLAHLAAAVRAEHERWDGKGYPDGLKGEQIPLASRITFVCDAYHAMTSDRPYRTALSIAQACAEIADGSGSQFCPDTADAFLEIMRTKNRE